MNIEMWQPSYEYLPSFPCTRCSRGRLEILPKALDIREPRYSKEHMQYSKRIVEKVSRFTCFMGCDFKSCGEIVVVSGDVTFLDEANEIDPFTPISLLHPKSFFPAPDIISFPKALSPQCVSHLRASFALVWADPAACSNKIRVFLEFLMDQFEIARTVDRGSGKSELSLFSRIRELQKARPGHTVIFDALRNVGNVGSHFGVLKFEHLIEAYEILEVALFDLIENKSARVEAIKLKLADRKNLI